MTTQPTKDIEVLKEKEVKMLEATAKLVINNQEDYDNLATLGKKVSAYLKQIDTKEKAITKPINDSLKQIRAMFKPFKETAEAKKAEIKSVMGEYIRAEEARRKIEEDRIVARAEKGTIREDTAVNKLAALDEAATETTGTTTSVLKVTILDIKAIPAEYLIVNESKIKEAYRNGVEVEGVKCEYETSIRL